MICWSNLFQLYCTTFQVIFQQRIQPVIKLGGNPSRWCPIQSGINYWSNWVEIHWDDAWSNWASSASYAWLIWPGIISMDFHPIWPIQPPNSTRQAYNVISMDFHPIHWDDAWLNWVEIHWDDAQFNQALITGRIGWKSTQMLFYIGQIQLGIISMDFHPI